ncbi:MAG TPA: hypothetical protein OQH54_06780 [Nitrosopumilus sp.]|nr:hypothetical protein [Thermoproteota archaeon]HJJ23401.1 hypothetical protein [Nitrosopumilus sp.]
MHKSLGDYNIEKSSSADIHNIIWTQKNPKDTKKSKKKKPDKGLQKSSATNIIYTQKPKKVKPHVAKVFKIEEVIDAEKSKKKNADKRHQHSSASNSKIKQGFKRPGR